MKRINNKLITKRKMGLVLLLGLFISGGGCAYIQERGEIRYPSDTENSAKDYKENPWKGTAIIKKIKNKNKTRFILDLRKMSGVSIKDIFHYPEKFLDNRKNYSSEILYQGKNCLIVEYTEESEK